MRCTYVGMPTRGDERWGCRLHVSDQRRSAERRRKSRARLLRADVRALGEAVVDPLDPVLVRRELRLVAVLLVARHAREVRRVVLGRNTTSAIHKMSVANPKLKSLEYAA